MRATSTLFPAVGLIDAPEQVEQGRLSGARRAHHGDEVAARDRKVEMVEDRDRLLAFDEALAHVPTSAPAQSAFTSSNSTMLVWPVMGTMTPGDLTCSLSPSICKKYTRSVSKIA